MNKVHYHLNLSSIYCESCREYIRERVKDYFQGSFLDGASQEIFILKNPNKKEELDEIIKTEIRKVA